jgi:predicted ATPase
MITLITGYNNTGKTTWIAETIGEKLKCDVKLDSYGDNYGYNVIFDKYGTDDSEDWYCFREGLNHCKQLDINVHKTICYIYPENCLHSLNQSELVNQYIEWNNKGFDIYIETHSDHIINAIRVAIKQVLIKPEDVKVLFFKAINDFVEIVIDNNGQFNKRPIGFCDEYGNQIDKLID